MVQLHLPHHGGHHHGSREREPPPPKGWVSLRVGQEGEEQLQRFVVPVAYLNHPLFHHLLKEAEEEYGFEHEGAITIPCHVEYFRRIVQGIVGGPARHGHHLQGSSGGAGHHSHFHLCFKA